MLPSEKTLTLPCGRPFRLDRLRSDGILRQDELDFCKTQGIPVAFDPMQSGWVLAQGVDDLFPNEITNPAHPRHGRVSTDVGLHLRLRPWTRTDAPRLTALLDDPLMWETLPEPYPDPLTEEIAEALIDISNGEDHHQVFAVLYDDVPIGQVRLHDVQRGEAVGTAELSYWIGRAYWGQGFASAAVGSFVTQCFTEDPALTSLVARVKHGNIASRRVLEKAGFVEDGTAGQGWDRLRRLR